MREEWTLSDLGKSCEILDNQREPITKRNRIAGSYPYYGATGLLDHVEGYLFDELLVLVGEDGAKWEAGENTAFPINGKCWVNNHAHVLRPKREILIDNWLIYYLNQSDLTPFTTGLTVPKLNQGKLREIPIPLPPLSEQKRIVSILDEVFANVAKATANAEKNLRNARELFESYLNNVFTQKGEGWEENRWGDLCHFVRGPFGGSLKKSMFKEKGYVVYEQKHAIHDHFNQLRYFIDEHKFNEMKRFEVKPGDIIMSCSGVTLGRVAVIPDNIPRGIINQALLKLTPNDGVYVFFIKHWLRSKIFQDIIFKHSGGAAIPNVPSGKILKEIIISLPNLQQQKIVVQEIELVSAATKRLEAIYRQKIAELAELKQSILQKAFTGELAKGTAKEEVATNALTDTTGIEQVELL